MKIGCWSRLLLTVVIGPLCFAPGWAKASPTLQAQEFAKEISKLEKDTKRLIRAGQYQQSLVLAQRALAISEKAKGIDNLYTRTALDRVGMLYQTIGRNESALPFLQLALDVSERIDGPVHPRTAFCLNNIAISYQAMGQYAAALALFQRALAISEKADGPEHLNTATYLTNLGVLYKAMGQYTAALPLLQRALAISEKAEGPVHLNTSGSFTNLGVLYQAMGQYAAALPLFQRALAISEKADGPEHLNISGSLTNLGVLHQAMGQYAAALPLFQRALAISEKAASSSFLTGAYLTNLGGLYEAMGQYAAALPLFQRALAISEKANGPEHTNTGICLHNLAELYQAMGRNEAALSAYQHALSIHEKSEGLEHPLVGANLTSLASMYRNRGQYEVARTFVERALAIDEKINGPEHPSTAISLNNLAELFLDMGPYETALPLFQRALAILLRRGKSPVELAQVEGNLATLHAKQHHPELAIYFGKRSVNGFQTLRGNLKSLDKELQQGFLKKHDAYYTQLSGWLIEAGRLSEAEQVLAMLKERELNELLRSNGTDLRRTQADYVGPERKALAEQQAKEAQGVKDAAELAELERRRKQGATLSADEVARIGKLREAAQAWQSDYQRYLTDLGKILAQNQRIGAEKTAKQEATELQKRVYLDPAGAVGLHYVVTDDRLAIIVATPRGSFGRWSAISKKELDQDIFNLRQAILERRDVAPSAKKLWQALIGPVAADLQAAGAKTLILSLSYNLRYLPFAALQNDEGRYLIQDYALSNWAGAVDVAPQASQRPWNVAGLGLTQARPGFAALPAVRGELAAIVRTTKTPGGVLPGTIALDEQFNREQLDAALNGPSNVLHVATHFDFKQGDEQGSRLIVGQGEAVSLAQIGVMNFRDIEQVTLSACETAYGGGINDNGAEVEGLAAAVLSQHAQAVLASLWKVADDSTARLMRDFYGQRAQTTPPSRAQALRHAQLALLEGQTGSSAGAEGGASRQASRVGAAPTTAIQPVDPTKPYAHPFFWAPFVLSGNWL